MWIMLPRTMVLEREQGTQTSEAAEQFSFSSKPRIPRESKDISPPHPPILFAFLEDDVGLLLLFLKDPCLWAIYPAPSYLRAGPLFGVSREIEDWEGFRFLSCRDCVRAQVLWVTCGLPSSRFQPFRVFPAVGLFIGRQVQVIGKLETRRSWPFRGQNRCELALKKASFNWKTIWLGLKRDGQRMAFVFFFL